LFPQSDFLNFFLFYILLSMRFWLIFLVLAPFMPLKGQGYIFLPMDETQTNHLKAYGLAYKALELNQEVWWLLNYKGGSFAFTNSPELLKECKIRDVRSEVIPSGKFEQIKAFIADPEQNMDALKLEVAPRVAVYTPKENFQLGRTTQPWDDAVMLALTYAEIPYTTIYDDEVLKGELSKYDWLHLHHEDFTGQYGRFYSSYRGAAWYKAHVSELEGIAKRNGFAKVSELKLAVCLKIREFVAGGGFMFAMCSATDTYDIALAAQNTDICDAIYDGDPVAANYQSVLDFSQTLAFKNFRLVENPTTYEFSDIDASPTTPPARNVQEDQDFFTLFDFSAKYDPVPSILTQCHTKTVKAFMGQTTAFRKKFLKASVLTLGENKALDESRYIHGIFGNGFWSFYGGHDPEDYRHLVEDPPTDLKLHPNSPGYRLILNNVLFPAAKKKKQKT
jgi:hypothetical protein